jgi:putative acetyltransferase
LNGVFAVDDPRADDVRALLGRHLAYTRAESPPEDNHTLEVGQLLDPAVTFFSFRIGGELLAVGALKRLGGGHAEIKSMHTAEAARRRGIGRAMVDHLVRAARERGYGRLSLETGSQPAFAPARALYASAGFVVCDPFAGYRQSPNSTFMTLVLPVVVGGHGEQGRGGAAGGGDDQGRSRGAAVGHDAGDRRRQAGPSRDPQ